MDLRSARSISRLRLIRSKWKKCLSSSVNNLIHKLKKIKMLLMHRLLKINNRSSTCNSRWPTKQKNIKLKREIMKTSLISRTKRSMTSNPTFLILFRSRKELRQSSSSWRNSRETWWLNNLLHRCNLHQSLLLKTVIRQEKSRKNGMTKALSWMW